MIVDCNKSQQAEITLVIHSLDAQRIFASTRTTGKGRPRETEYFSEISGIGGGTARANKAGSSVQVAAIRFIAGLAS